MFVYSLIRVGIIGSFAGEFCGNLEVRDIEGYCESHASVTALTGPCSHRELNEHGGWREDSWV